MAALLIMTRYLAYFRMGMFWPGLRFDREIESEESSVFFLLRFSCWGTPFDSHLNPTCFPESEGRGEIL